MSSRQPQKTTEVMRINANVWVPNNANVAEESWGVEILIACVFGMEFTVYDHRPESLRIAQRTEDYREILAVVCQPAEVVIMQQEGNRWRPYYVNLYPISPEASVDRLFSVSLYSVDGDLGQVTRRNQPYWLQWFRQRDPDGNPHQLIVAAVTDTDHNVVVNRGYQQWSGDGEDNLETHIGLEVQTIPKAAP